MCSLFAFHQPWERVSLHIFNHTSRKVIGLCRPHKMYDLLHNDLSLDWQESSNISPETSDALYYACMLGSAHEAVKSLGRNCTVIIFSDGLPHSESFARLKDLPEDYVKETFLPLPYSSPIFFTQFSDEDYPKSFDIPPFEIFLQANEGRGRAFSVETIDPVRCSAALFLYLYEPWIGNFTYPTKKTPDVEEVCLYPNPWGLRGSLCHQPAEKFVRFNKGSIEKKKESTDRLYSSVVLPSFISPFVWTKKGRRTHGSISKALKLWEPWIKVRSFKNGIKKDIRKSAYVKLVMERWKSRQRVFSRECSSVLFGFSPLRVWEDDSVLRDAVDWVEADEVMWETFSPASVGAFVFE